MCLPLWIIIPAALTLAGMVLFLIGSVLMVRWRRPV